MISDIVKPIALELPAGIRRATTEDIPAMVELGELFFNETILGEMTQYDPESMAMTLMNLVSGINSVAIVMEQDGEIVGGIGGYMLPSYFNMNAMMGQQVFWYVHPKYRSHRSVKLLQGFEQWCKSVGCHMIWSGAKMNENNEAMSAMLQRRGYKPLETVLIKGV